MRDKLINKMAEAIFIARDGERNRARFNEQKEPYFKDAESAFDALLGELEETTYKHYRPGLNEIIHGCSLTPAKNNAKELYQQLLDMRKE